MINFRSELSRQVSGYLEGSLLASEYHQEDPSIGLETVIFVVDDDAVAEEICSENVSCFFFSYQNFKNVLCRFSATEAVFNHLQTW